MMQETLETSSDPTKVKEKSHDDELQIDWSGRSFTVGGSASSGKATT
jgi:hypothetical protein